MRRGEGENGGDALGAEPGEQSAELGERNPESGGSPMLPERLSENGPAERPWRGEPGQGRAGPGEDEGNAVETESAGLRLWVCARLCWQGDAPSQAGRMHA